MSEEHLTQGLAYAITNTPWLNLAGFYAKFKKC